MKTESMYDIIIRPLVTEKGTFQAQDRNAYSFMVASHANKAQVKQAIEKIYDVKVRDVRTANHKGKPRRYGRITSHTRNWKKAVVVLHDDYHIDLF
jgi:large subunit ribosomal protein L23